MTDNEIYSNWPLKIRYLRKECWKRIKACILRHDITSVLEFGSGLSTVLFNNLGVDTISYETNPVYLRAIKSFNLSNVEFRLWDNITANIEGYFGLSLVDGILPRVNQLHYAQLHARYIAIDDYTDPKSNEGLPQMLSDYACLDKGEIKLSIFRRNHG